VHETFCEVRDVDRYYVGRQDRHQDEDRHQDRLRQGHQDRQGHQYVDHQDHQDHPGHQYEEQNLCVGRQDHQVHQYVGRQDRQGHQYEDHQDQDDYLDQDGNQHHQGRGVRHQDQDGNQDELHQALRDRLEAAEWADQLPTLGLEAAEWAERQGHRERRDHEEAYRLVAFQEELTESTAQVALTAWG
jgi:hypothetical protein